jgi:hypothetical protein
VLRFGHDKDKSRLPVMTLQLRSIEKPPKSKIKLTKNSSSLSICIPPVELHNSLRPFIGFAIFWNGLLLLMTVEAFRIPSPNNWGLAAFSIPFWAIGLFIVYGCLFLLYSTTQLKIENQTVEYAQFLFGRRIGRRKTVARSEIYKLAFTPKYHSYDADGDRREHLAQLQIDAGSQEIILGGISGGIKNEAEVEWLAYEISDWLDISLRINDFSSDPRSSLVQATVDLHEIQPLKSILSEVELQYLSKYHPVKFQAQAGQYYYGSKIDKTPSSLSVEIASSISKSSLYFFVIFTLGWCGIAWKMFCHDPFYSIPLVVFGTFLILLTDLLLLMNYYGKSYLRIENQSISFSQTLLGRKSGNRKSLHRSEISKLTVTCRQLHYIVNGQSRQLKTAEFLIGNEPQQINLSGIGNETELIWLANEISELLDIPLEIIKPPEAFD